MLTKLRDLRCLIYVPLPIWLGCQDTTTSPPPQAPQTEPPLYTPPQAAYGSPPAYGQPPPYAPPAPPPAPAPPSTPGRAPASVVSPVRPLLGPLIGSPAWQAEAQAVVQEVVANLAPADRARVVGVPLVLDPNPNEVNAFAACDDSGSPFIAGTEGLLEAIDAISQTKATDELFGTQTYAAYASSVAPRLVSKDGGSAMLSAGIIALQYWADPRRISRAHEMFDEIVAFTFGHELAHHYMGHTGCANGQAGGAGPPIEQLGRFLTGLASGFNQPNEIVADSKGCESTLATGRARMSRAYRWNEEGGLWLLDFFARLDGASGANPFLGFLRTHPNPGLRIPIVQTVATTWRLQHPG